MYVQETDFTPDYYDSVKIGNDLLKTKIKTKPFIDMKKQTKRDYSKLLQGNDFYANIQRDNARIDYIKSILSEAT